MKALRNGRIILENGIVENKVLLFAKTIINIIEESAFNPEQVEEIIDAEGQYISPGFINIHIHGCAGADTMDGTAAALQLMQAKLPISGVTAFLPTTMTYDFPTIYHSLDNIRQLMNKTNGAKIIGAHMEGPFISEQFKGAQAAKNIAAPDFSKIAAYTDVVRLITLAPENLADNSFLAKCKKNNIIASMGHTAADYPIAMQAIQAGVSHATHLFNTYLPLHHRQPGAIGAALDSNIVCEIIADNIHVHPMLQRLLYKQKGAGQIALITDSMRACMMPEGESELGGQRVLVKNKEARLADGSLAGSILLMNEAVRNFWQNTQAPLYEVIKMAGLNQARELGLEQEIGSLAIGKLADIVLFDEEINISRTFVDGKLVYNGKQQEI